MTQDQKEAALNCVYAYETSDVYKALQDALTELEAHKAIAASFVKAEQEPVGYFAYDEEHDIWEELTGPNAPGATPLYTAPARTKDLTDDELNKLLDYWSEDERSAYGGAWQADGEYVDMKSFARAVIAADREKNK